MALSDTKKVQTFINVCGNEIQSMRDSAARIEAMRTLFQAHNPSVIGTALQGNTAALNTAFGLLQTELNKAIWTGLINAVVPSHEGRALDG